MTVSSFCAAAALGLGILGIATAAHAEDVVRVGVVAIYPPYSVPYAAEELGLYKKAGLKVETTLYNGTAVAEQALNGGLADVITTSPHGAALAISKGVKERIIAFTGDVAPQGWFIMVRNDSPLKDAADLSGKTIGIGAKGSLTDLIALVATSSANVTAKTIPMTTTAIPPALKAKQVDAAVVWPLLSYREISSGDYRPVFDFSKFEGTLVLSAWAASTDMLDKQPDVLRRWLAANQQAIEHMQSHEDWTLGFLKHYADEKDDAVARQAYEGSIKHLHADQAVTPEWLKAELALAVKAGVPDPGNADKIYDPGFVPKWTKP